MIKITKTNNINITKYKGVIAYGIPQETSRRDRHDNRSLDKPTYNNAEILAIMERGSPVNNIPPRPLLDPVRNKYKKEIDASLTAIGRLILLNKISEADAEMEKLALRIEGWCKKYFTDSDNNWAPNSPITIYGGWMKNKVSGKPIYIKGKHSDRPLIDTGSLRQSIKSIFHKDGLYK